MGDSAIITDTTSATTCVLEVMESTPIKVSATGLTAGEQIEIFNGAGINVTSGTAISDGTNTNTYIETTNNPRTILVAGTYWLEKPVTAAAVGVYVSHERGKDYSDVTSHTILAP